MEKPQRYILLMNSWHDLPVAVNHYVECGYTPLSGPVPAGMNQYIQAVWLVNEADYKPPKEEKKKK